jgi:SAM-dependent methyltransferase
MNNSWNELHETYKEKDWVKVPSIFAEQAIDYFPKTGKVLELGAGHGQDSIFFASKGYEVVSTDIETMSLNENIAVAPEDIEGKISTAALDLAQPIEFTDESFDVVYAHLSLHYLDQSTTEKMFTDIHRILKPGGVLAFLVNSVEDPECGTGTRLEDDYYEIEGRAKRYFTKETAQRSAHIFTPLLMDDKGESLKDNAKDIHNLIRFIGTKT